MADVLKSKMEDRLFWVKVGKVLRDNLYEMTRKYWKARLEKASKATHVLAINEGKVIVFFNYIQPERTLTHKVAHEDGPQYINYVKTILNEH